MTGTMPMPSDTTHTNVNARAFVSDRPAWTRSRHTPVNIPTIEPRKTLFCKVGCDARERGDPNQTSTRSVLSDARDTGSAGATARTRTLFPASGHARARRHPTFIEMTVGDGTSIAQPA